MRYYFTTTEMGKSPVLESDMLVNWGKLKSLYIASGRGSKMVQLLWKSLTVPQKSIKSPYDPAISLLGICPRKLKIFCKNLHSSIIRSSRNSPGICRQVTHCEIPLTLDVKDVSTEGHALYDSPHNRCPEWANPEKRKSAGDFQVLAEGRSRC